MSKLDSNGYTMRSLMANKLLDLSEAAQDLQLKTALLRLEEQVMQRDGGPTNHQSLEKLNHALETAKALIASNSLDSSLAHVHTLKEDIETWQAASDTHNAQGGIWMELKRLFSKKAREADKRQQMIASLEAEMSKLDQMSANLTASMEKDESTMELLKQTAAKLQPSSGQYKRLRNQFGIVEKRHQLNTLNFQQLSRSMEYVGNQLSIIKSEQDMVALGKYMPENMEKANLDLGMRMHNIEQMVEQTKIAHEGVSDIMEDIGGLIDAETSTSFDANVAQIRIVQENLAVLGVSEQEQDEQLEAVPEVQEEAKLAQPNDHTTREEE